VVWRRELPTISNDLDCIDLLNARLAATARSDANLLAIAPEHFPKALLESHRLVRQEVSVLLLVVVFHT